MKKLLLLVAMVLLLVSTVSAIQVEPVDMDVTGRLAIVSGTVYNSETGEPVGAGIPVNVYCEHNGVDVQLDFGNLVTNDQGIYSAWTMNLISVECAAGDEAWVEVDYNEQSFTSERVTLVNSGAVDVAGVDASVGVPEFTTITLAAAVLFVGLGLVVLRKNF